MPANDEPSTTFLQQAYDAAEASYTLDLGEDDKKNTEDEND